MSKNEKSYKVIQTSELYKVIDEDNFAWGIGHTTKGAVISAMNCGVRLGAIDFNSHYVPIKECIEAVK